MAANQALVGRRGLREKREVLGRHVGDIFAEELARRYAGQDEAVLRKSQLIIDRLELHSPGLRAGSLWDLGPGWIVRYS